MILISNPQQYVRQYGGPLDKDFVFATTAERMAYLTSPRRYGGQIASDLESGQVYQLNAARTSWGSITPTREFLMQYANNAAALAAGLTTGDKYYLPYNNGAFIVAYVIDTLFNEDGTPLLNENGTVLIKE